MRAADSDLLAVLVATLVLVALAFVPALAPLRPLALPALLVAPGYAFVAACYPSRAPADESTPEGPDDPRLSTLGRLALSLAGSVAVVAAVGLPLALLGRFAARPVVAGIGALVAALLVVAWARRRRQVNAFGVDPAAARSRVASWSHGTSTDAVLTVACVVALVVTGGVVYADTTATNADPASAALLGPVNDSASTDTGTLTVGTTTTYRVAVSSPGTRSVNATVVPVVETYGPNATNGTTLPAPTERRVLTGQTRIVDANATAAIDVPVRPTERAPNARLVFLVYRDDVPAEPTIGTAASELHRWVAIDAADAGTDVENATGDAPDTGNATGDAPATAAASLAGVPAV
ncbi:hypothetical protein GCM10009066_21700 [Halarchaeum salinum]|uniref:DUF1616 domain-containing protein n=1 Tax=Halarchaeum salinum TaxID=489912 RepID=A0AAV3SA35_9EURY